MMRNIFLLLLPQRIGKKAAATNQTAGTSPHEAKP
jgi:hypothetical protein